ncbi:amidase domain-containing protein [Amnibacterium kyonggiense]|uniref:Putative amidase-like protein n=1 Tax=Amnibacterium kyonggiense TaxID=595671 RepID=A0A4V3EBB0_9MICO|nr:amidase domain-containing protein [Amnibacterium kyonggiense]TDS79684.1 putative amidase-like protein [Amnibacterium kyonggiense]
MNARTTTITTTLAAGLVAALAFAATGPAGAVTPAPTPSSSASATPTTGPSASPTPTSRATTPPAGTVTPTASPVLTPSASPTPTPTPTPTPVVPLPSATAVTRKSGHTAYSRTATMTGIRFTNLAGVQVAGTPVGNLQILSDTKAQFVIPNAADYQPKIAAITLTAKSDPTPRATGFTFQYKVANALDRQMAYAFANWNAYSNSTFGYLSGNDCANFASQTLLARGWKRSPQWFNYGAGDWSGTWVSSTALSSWLSKRPDLATRLVYSQRDAVVVGDIVQFRWPGHPKSYSSWDHTAIVSKVVVLPNGRHDIYYVAHTLNRQYGGGTTGLASWYAGQKIKGQTLRIQFFHLLR